MKIPFRDLRIHAPLAASLVLSLSSPAFSDELPVVAFWQFNASDPYADSSGNNRGIDWTTRPVDCSGGYARFEPGTSGFFGRRALDLSSYPAVTIEMFLRLDTYRLGQMVYFTHYAYNGAGTGFFGMHGGENDKDDPGTLVVPWLKNDSTNTTVAREIEKSDPGALGDMKWHHVAIVVELSDDASATDEMKLYVDGVLQGHSTGTGHHSATFRNTHFMLGGCSDANGVGYKNTFGSRASDYSGDMDDVRITAAALGPSQFLTGPTVEECAVPAGAVEWTGGAAPAAGSDVHVPSGAAFAIEGQTPVFASIAVDGTLLFDSSNNCLRAESVVVGPAGRLQAGAPYGGNTAISNRVHVSCGDFALAHGGRVNAAGAGFWGGVPNGSSYARAAAGPGAGYNNQDNRTTAAPHGGFNTTSPIGRGEYGSAEFPETAGSGGSFSQNDIAGGNGGGVVRIDATGRVAVDGVICADSPDLVVNTTYGRSGAGSGGSILVNCERISGTGSLQARGGSSSGAERGQWTASAPGAGGRIAVHYNPAVQTFAEAKGLVFEAQAGKSHPYGYSFPETGFWMYAGAGTLWFPDAALIGAENLSNFRGRLVNAPVLAFDGDVVVSNWVGFATDGVRITVDGDLTVTGEDGRLEIGGVAQIATDANIQRKGYVSETASLLSVAGSLVVTNAARIDLYAAATNAAQTVGARVSVGRSLQIGPGCYVYPFTHPANGGAPLFEAADFEVAAGGTFGIEGGGLSGRKGGNGYGPGYGSAAFGAGHGGLGGRVRTWDGDVATTNSTQFGKVYGDALRPLLPGSGGGHGWGGQDGGGVGGAALHVVATNSIRIAGAVVADGTTPRGYNNGSTAGSGGSVLLETRRFEMDPETASITARGGDSGATTLNSGKYTAGGGGGRIAIWSGRFLWEPEWKPSRYVATDEIPAEWAGVFDVSGGAARLATSAYAGEDGTVRLVATRGVTGTILCLQ